MHSVLAPICYRRQRGVQRGRTASIPARIMMMHLRAKLTGDRYPQAHSTDAVGSDTATSKAMAITLIEGLLRGLC